MTSLQKSEQSFCKSWQDRKNRDDESDLNLENVLTVSTQYICFTPCPLPGPLPLKLPTHPVWETND